ncbi:hypothetical protein JIN84_03895 [Luteolibacter yonseiensis]|uniref:Uncharacterized protein n=1 Tax=Luteolibacter yonseiensis TaxID=1144680 RepID=A0A934R1S7_9BACT|nr:hypothetical protein [Luteolibacter yonseiensis]MBK1814741.1 hypothetical protein [Luteolibacter yonseiensis]
MHGHSPDFIIGRIRWRAAKHGLPTSRTGFWEDSPDWLQADFPANFVNPVLYSVSDCGEMATVIGTEEIMTPGYDDGVRIAIDEMDRISSPCIGTKRKVDFDALAVVTKDLVEHLLPVESGKGCFAVWNILLTLGRMQR